MKALLLQYEWQSGPRVLFLESAGKARRHALAATLKTLLRRGARSVPQEACLVCVAAQPRHSVARFMVGSWSYVDTSDHETVDQYHPRFSLGRHG